MDQAKKQEDLQKMKEKYNLSTPDLSSGKKWGLRLVCKMDLISVIDDWHLLKTVILLH